MNKPGLEMLHAKADAALARYRWLEKNGSPRDCALAQSELRQVMGELAEAGIVAVKLGQIEMVLGDPEPEVTAPKLKFAGGPMQKFVDPEVVKYNDAKTAVADAEAFGDEQRIAKAKKRFRKVCIEIGIILDETDKMSTANVQEAPMSSAKLKEPMT
jgi:hypothetical protein